MKRSKSGMMDWRSLLTAWSKDLMQTKLAQRVEPPPQSPDWLGYDPATASEIQELEQRLGVSLPSSYKAFLLASNGWRRTTVFVNRLRPTQEVNWFRVENEQWAELYAQSGSALPDTDYYVYAEDGAADHRAEHMTSLLQISDVEDGVYLLNPEAVTPDGEWEAWFFANWIPGAQRFPSFAHLMLYEYQKLARLEHIKKSARSLPTLEAPAADVPRVPAKRRRQKKAKAPSLELLIEQMRSTEDEVRAQAVRTLHGKLKGRFQAERRPDLVQGLTDLFYETNESPVRAACVAALTELAEDGKAPAPLLDALSDSDPSVVLSGIFALAYFPDARAAEPLCQFIESGKNVLYNESAITQLRKMKDGRAVPTLAKVLLDTKNTFDQSFSAAAMALAQCGPKGFDALAAALHHQDVRVRRAAALGLGLSNDPRAAGFLDNDQRT